MVQFDHIDVFEKIIEERDKRDKIQKILKDNDLNKLGLDSLM